MISYPTVRVKYGVSADVNHVFITKAALRLHQQIVSLLQLRVDFGVGTRALLSVFSACSRHIFLGIWEKHLSPFALQHFGVYSANQISTERNTEYPQYKPLCLLHIQNQSD
jgi:hypothetical protein